MKFAFGLLTLLLALVISGVAAFFSVAGLAAIFAATAKAVILMGCALEAGKLVTAAWLHSNWNNPRVSKLHKGYMVGAVVALMTITALGIYGFLAKGHLEQQTPLAPVELQIAQKTDQIAQADADLKAQQTRLGQLDGAVNSMIGGDKAAMAMRFRAKQGDERAAIQKAIQADNDQKNKLAQELVPLKLQVNEVETKLGPVKYVAQLFGLKDTEGAVRLVILILMSAFDPLAVVLVISGAMTLAEAAEEAPRDPPPGIFSPLPPEGWKPKAQREPDEAEAEFLKTFQEAKATVDPTLDLEPAAAEPEWVIEDFGGPPPGYIAPGTHVESLPDGNLLLELENAKSDRDLIVELLELKPELLQEVIDTVTEEMAKKKAVEVVSPPPITGWMDANLKVPPR